MSRMSTAPSQRSLSLTEELEKLEQSITLTLQEIDHNFSRAHRIVTSSILPVVEQYAEHSKNVWEGSKFWKQFFEASANVSLNGYEETATDDGRGEDTELTEENAEEGASSSSYNSPPQAQNDFSTPASAQRYADYPGSVESSSLASPNFATPRPSREEEFTMEPHASPYEKLRREIKGQPATLEEDSSDMPSTPRAQTLSRHMPDSSPFEPPSTAKKTPANDVLLHRVLDRNYRIQATPHAQPKLPRPGTATRQARTPTTTRRGYTRTLELDSSPLEEAPQLHLDFSTPAKNKRIPGVSVLTPAKSSARKPSRSNDESTRPNVTASWDSDSDEEELAEGMSPPKTMQFHVPQSKLLKTPAQEASKRIVEDLLATAGGNSTEDYEDDSPSVIKRGVLEEDTF
ncbi:MAG: DASH complex subunit ask1 [Stictis urceolatum]|nr:DASH complex subunit ask1 [Stictis urceolata]